MSLADHAEVRRKTAAIGSKSSSPCASTRRRLRSKATLAGIVTLALVVLIAAGLGGRALIRSATTVPHPGPTEGMEAKGFHPSAHLEGRDLVLPLQFVNGASIDLVLPPGTNAGHFNFDPE
jgi:hypothetical protein